MLKRWFDILLSAAGLVFSLPLWGLIAVGIKLEDGGPVFYRQQRVGKGSREFTALKFRSMVSDSDQTWGAVPASANDPRITRVGRMLRASALDELPQLWNILRGEMSFVGPRAEWVELVRTFRREIPGFDQRHAVQPGLTGLAQVYGHSELSRRWKLRYDLLYIRKKNFWLDTRLIAVSFLTTFLGKWEEREGKLPRWLSHGWRRRVPAAHGRHLPLYSPSLAPERQTSPKTFV